MNNKNIIEQIWNIVNEILQTEPEYFCVNVRIKPTNNIKIYIDGDNGISIDKCVFFNRNIYKAIEEKNWFPSGEFSLEISSPGVDEPIIFYRQYLKNKGRVVEIISLEGEKKEGKLVEITPEEITIQRTEGKGKNIKEIEEKILLSNIKTTKVQIKF